MDLTLLIFLVVYLAMGLGHLPGFKVDRTGAAIVGAYVDDPGRPAFTGSAALQSFSPQIP